MEGPKNACGILWKFNADFPREKQCDTEFAADGFARLNPPGETDDRQTDRSVEIIVFVFRAITRALLFRTAAFSLL